MGALQKLVELLQRLDPDNILWRQHLEASARRLEVGSEGALAQIAEVFQNDGGDYARKLYLIEKCLFGVDIQPIAIQIAKLRFFISLAIEQHKTDDATQNFGIRPLPNLETKLVAANTLLGLGGQTTLSSPEAQKIQDELESVRAAHFKARSWSQKKTLRERDAQLRSQLAAELQDIGLEGGTAQKLAAWNPYDQNASAPFFAPHWMFGIQNGFDIVIGNPPYGAKLDADLQKYFRSAYPSLVQFKIDSFALFIIVCKRLLLKANGSCCLIVPNALLNNFFLSELRKSLIESTTITTMVNFKKSVFEAVVHTMIINFVNIAPVAKHEVRMSFDIQDLSFGFAQRDFASIENYAFEFRNNSENQLMKAVWKQAVKLGTVLDLRQTIKTGDDKTFVSSIKKGKNSKPILRGRDIGRYWHRWPGLYVEYGKHLACPRDPKIFTQPHILIRETGAGITATYEVDNHYIMSSAYCGIQSNRSYDLRYLLALLNSRLFGFLMHKANFENTAGAFTKAKIYHYEQLPIFYATAKQQAPIISKVEAILAAKKADAHADTAALEKEIDGLVYALYGLNGDEIALVEG